MTGLHAIKLEATIDESRRLQLDLPADTAFGEAEVIVLLPQTTASASSMTLLQLFEKIDRSGRPRLAADEVDRWVESRHA